MLRTAGAEEAIAETASKLDKTRRLNAREEDLDGRDEGLTPSEGLLRPVERRVSEA